MPAVNGTANNYFLDYLWGLQRRIQALETQQNWGVTDDNGVMRVRGGVQSDKTYGIWIFGPTGAVVLKLGDLGGGVTAGPYGLGVFNATSDAEVFLGQLVAGESVYGLSVLKPGGTPGTAADYQRVGGVGSSEQLSTITTNSTSWHTLTGDQTVTVNIGPSGQALISLSGLIYPGSYTAGESAYMGVGVNGSEPVIADPYLIAEEPSNNGLGGSYSMSWVKSGLTQGSHTFRPYYKVTTSGVTAKYANRLLTVSPL
jgi:hypothetical protein